MPKKLNLPLKNCLYCGKLFTSNDCYTVADFKLAKFCSRNCCKKYKVGVNHHNWTGGTRTRKDGYVRDSKDRYIHRLIMEEHLGRQLTKDEQVHHLDGNTSNNEITNLAIFNSNSDHRKYHAQIQKRNKYGRFAT